MSRAVDARPRVLVADDHAEMAEMLADGLVDRGFDAVAAGTGRVALARLESEHFDLLVTDLRMADVDGLALLARSRALSAERPVIIMTAYGAVDSAVEAVRLGAHHYLTKPFKLDELVLYLERALEGARVRSEAASLRRALQERFGPAGMVGRGKAMRRVFEVIERIADTAAPVLILGETGTGKGMVATALHVASRRAPGPFVAVNCAALPEALLESELFGHVKGAFTGATANRQGLFAQAEGGTILLDEVGEMPLALQAKLLHVLEQRRVRPVGGDRAVDIDVRVVAATNRDLRALARDGAFREDLLYRLDVLSIELPPLRQRPEDVPELLERCLAEARGRYPEAAPRRFAPAAVRRLVGYGWPGNVRELAHVVERAVLLGRGEEISEGDLPAQVREPDLRDDVPFRGEVMPIRRLQRRYATWALAQHGDNRSRTAEKLGIDFKTLARWLQEDAEERAAPTPAARPQRSSKPPE